MNDLPRVDIVNFNFFDWDGDRVLLGGAERYVIELARLVRSLGAEPRILQNANRPFAKVYDDVPVLGIPAATTMDMKAMSVGFSDLVRDAALVIASPLELAAGLSSSAPVIGINHGIHWDYPNNRLDVHDPALERGIIDAVLACRACVCVDTNFYNWVRCLDAEASARLRFIPNFVDLGRFQATQKRFDGPRLELLFPRRLCAERGFREIVTAFDYLLPRHPSLNLHLCGSGADDDEQIARAFVLRHPQQVRWSTLEMDEMPTAYATSHVVLIPTVFAEGTSLSCIEAMATNNAVVTTAVGGLPNLVIDGYNGVIASPGAIGIIDAVERLARDRVMIERLARNALSVAPSFARERWLARWTTLLMEVLPELRFEQERLAQGAHGRVEPDPYLPVAWPFGLEAERDRLLAERDAALVTSATNERDARDARAAQALAEQQLYWRDSELGGIKSSTGWAVLQQMYRIRFAIFPRGSRREAAAKWMMHRVRALRRRLARPTGSTLPAAATRRTDGPPSALVPPPAKSVPTPYAIVCLPILEWSFRFQRPQQLARRFASMGHEVLFAKHTFGPDLSSRAIEPGIDEIELPGVAGTNPYRDRLGDEDAQRMAETLLAHLANRGSGRFVCLVQLPFWAGVAQRLREASGCDVVYDCMDLHSGFSSNSKEALVDEARLLADADLVVCASRSLLEHATTHARRTALVRNGVDYEHFAGVPAHIPAVQDTLTIGYYGAIADWFDSPLVAGIARLRPHWQIVLIGSTWSAETAPLESAANISLLGEKPYATLPALIANWDCCVIPFLHTPLTAATNPVKVYEMLAAAKPVVSVALPELAPMGEAGLVTLAEGPEAFVAAIEAQVAIDSEERRMARRAYAKENTWELRAEAIIAAIDAVLPQVSIVVVTYNNRELNKLCLASIFDDTDYPDFEVIVVDNASKDGTPEMLEELAKRNPRLRVILNRENKGFAAANNQGAAIARGRYLCFLNNDTVVHGAWLRTLVGHLRRHSHLGLVGPVTNAIGNEARIPVGYGDLAGMPAWADRHCALHRGRLVDVSMLAFFCVAVPRQVWRLVGPLDERFGTGMFEDDDYNRRVRAAGFEVGLAWDSFVHHWQMASFKLLGDDEYLRIYRANEALYASKWANTLAAENSLTALHARAASARGTVIFAPSVGWAIDLAQRPHHLARVLAEDGYVVVFDVTNAGDEVDTLREVTPGLFLYKGSPAALSSLPRIVLWTFSYNYDYRDNFAPGTTVIYDWIDDLTVFPYDQRKLEALHARALSQADVVLCVARRLHERALPSRPDALYLPNAVEEGRFDREPNPNPALTDPEFARVLDAGRPIAGYYGALAKWFDYSLLNRTAQLRPDWSFVLIGPDHDGSLARSKLDRLPNVYCLGPRPYSALPGYLHRFDVATIPFAINDITLATSPLKLYEYFAAGRPVISTPMPECAAFREVRIVGSAEEFSAALDSTRRDRDDAAFHGRLTQLAARNTWRARARAAMEAVEHGRVQGRLTPIWPPPAGNTAQEIAGSDEATLSPLAHSIMKRFAKLETSGNGRYFRALAAHLAGSHDDPCLPMYFEFALSANERGRKAATLIESFVPLSGKRVLDVGCAYGGFVVALGEFGADPVGFDIDDSLLALAEHNFRDVGKRYPVLHADVTKAEDIADFRDTFDVITCNDVIEHVSDPAVTLHHIASMLRAGGLAFFEIPNRDSVDAVVCDGHYQLFGITQLDRESAGRYYGAHAPGLRYGVEHYLRIDEYRALFAGAGLSMNVVEDATTASVSAVRSSLAALRANLPAHLKRVPSDVREEVKEAVIRYLDEADAVPHGSSSERSEFLQRYGTGFWRMVARKSAPAGSGAPIRAPAAPSRPSAVQDSPAPPALAHKKFLRGVCNVCGNQTRFFRDDPSLDRESLTCEHCRTTSRYRSIARGVLTAIAARTGIRVDALAHLPVDAPDAAYAVYDTQPAFRFEPCAYPLPDLLGRCRWIDITVSSYRADLAPGVPLANGVMNQNLERLTFPDASFDLVVTSDVMEHVRLDGRAHAEIARVLKPGGAYVFTVPHFRDRRETFVRVQVRDPEDPSRDEFLTEPEYHGDANAAGGRGALSFRSYGTVLDDELDALGFDVAYSFADDDIHGIRNTELFYCVKRTHPA